MRCGDHSLVGIDGGEAGVYPLACKRWTCRECGAKKLRRVAGQLSAGMKLGRVRFFTLTAPGDEDAATTWREFGHRWKLFHQRLKRLDPSFEYLGVVEPQKRGHPHIHVVYRGEFIHWRVLRRLARESGFGKVADIRAAHGRTASYLVKYLTKELRPPAKANDTEQPDQGHQAPPYFRRVRMSTGWCEARHMPESRWSDWRILDGPPLHAALEVQRRGYRVVDLVVGSFVGSLPSAFKLRWVRRLRERWTDKPRRAA